METADPFPLVLIINAKIVIQTIDLYTIISIIASFFLLIMSALISGAETAYFSLKSDQVKEIKKQSDFRSRLIIKHLKNPKKILATLTIANGFINVCFIVVMGIMLTLAFDFTKLPSIGFIIKISIIAFILLLFGEFLPKFYAKHKAKKFVRHTAILIIIFDKLFHPFSMFMINTTSIIGKKLATIKQNITIDDLSQALNITTHQITEDENILKGIVKFGNIDVKEIMKSRVDVLALEIETQFKNILTLIIESGHSRIPVYSETFDNIKGILFIKDLLPHFGKDNDFKWQSLIRNPYFVPENKKINDLLQEFQANKIHMAIVIDEYGGTSGIVTLEDVLEEIVGEITDESEKDEIFYSQINENTYIFKGKTLLNDFLKIVDIDDDLFDDVKGDADTIAGIILELTGEIPAKNKKIDFKNLTFTIESVDKRRIKQIKVAINK
ncbi:MAG: gliding motility-associated protein GldE [Bacteroidales bacterium]|nr:gliding motility-associated protein GldE [Bacteroidales bacterium]